MNHAGSPPPVQLAARPADGHKGTFGTVLIVGGCDEGRSMMVGGPAFAAIGSLRAGAGRAQMLVPRTLAASCLSVAPSATAWSHDGDPDKSVELMRDVLPTCQSLVIGPGLGTGPTAVALVKAAVSATCPVIIDADALNIMAREPRLLEEVGSQVVLTPHPGEYQRLAEGLSLNPSPRSDQERSEAARSISSKSGAVTVLKGHRTVVSDGDQIWICDRGSVALATAGTGDVLSGILGGLSARTDLELSLFDRVRLSVWIHAVAGERWAATHGDGGLLAMELAAEVPQVISSLET
ncbi:MAG: NAD(P)H-hydrate dehydratase [Phycisphaerae bacterium]|nr:NAD(P)H-hydrate dehydratase [Phycisphaerae bacterium]